MINQIKILIVDIYLIKYIIDFKYQHLNATQCDKLGWIVILKYFLLQDSAKFHLQALNVKVKTGSGKVAKSYLLGEFARDFCHWGWCCVDLKVWSLTSPCLTWVCGRQLSAAPTCATKSRTTPSPNGWVSTRLIFRFSPLESWREVSAQVGS